MIPLLPLGPFAVGAPLGRGAMGSVYAARHLSTGTPAAVKVLDRRFGGDEARAAFRHEVERMAALDHPGIVPIFDHGVVPERAALPDRPTPGAPYLVMALAEHGSLAGVGSRLDWPSVAAVLAGVLDALAHAHARGLVHCDLKPENVLLSSADGALRPLLADFGVSHAFRDEARTESLGTPAFMAPEQFVCPIDIGPWTDLYALGCLAWELVCHRLPYEAGNPLGYAVAHTQGQRAAPTPALAGVPAPMAAWLERLLARDWRARFPSAAAARAALARFAPVGADIQLPLGGGAIDPTGPTVADDALRTESLDRGGWHSMTDPPTGPPPPAPTHPPLPADWRGGAGERPRPLRGAGRALFGLRVPPFVGREAERDRLWAALRAVHGGGSRAVILRGAAGTGKSRLARWMVERADELGGGWPVVLRHADPPLPGDGLAGALRRLVQPTGTDDDLDRVRRLRRGAAPDALDGLIARQCADTLDGPTLPPGRRHGAAAAFFGAVAAGRPLLVFVDDAQWGADGLAFAEGLLDDPQAPPALVLVTARSDLLDERPAIAAQLDRLAARPEAEVIDLEPLDAATHAELVRRLLPLDGATVDRVVARTAGHPLFAMQLLGEWLDRDALLPTRAGFAVSPEAAGAVPASLAGLWGPRLAARVPDPGERLAVEVGAALGERVDGAEWRAACAALGVAPAADLLDRLARAGLARTDRDGWRFAHGLARDAVWALVASDGRRGRLHRACAQGLAGLDPARSPAAMARIAEHWIAAGDAAAALGPLRAAAWLLIDRMHRAEVHPLVDRHDALLDGLGAPADDPRRARALVLRAFLAFADADLDASRRLFDAARPAVERSDLPSERGRLLRLRGMIARHLGEHEAAERLLRAAEAQCLAAGLVAEAGKAALGRADLCRRRSDPAGFAAAIDAAEAHFIAADDPFWLGTARMERVRLMRVRGELAPAEALARAVVGTARRAGDEANEARGHHALAELARLRRDLPRSAASVAAAQAIFARTGNINHAMLDGERAVHALIAGDLEGAAALAAAADRALSGTMWSGIRPSRWLLIALAARAAGRDAEVEPLLARFEGALEPLPVNRVMADELDLIAAAFLRLGDLARARRLAGHAARLWRAVGDTPRAEAAALFAGQAEPPP